MDEFGDRIITNPGMKSGKEVINEIWEASSGIDLLDAMDCPLALSVRILDNLR